MSTKRSTCFIDYNKAFDKVRHKLLIEALKQLIIELNNCEPVFKPNQQPKQWKSNEESDKVLFFRHSSSTTKTIENEEGGIRVNDISSNNLRC